MEVKMKLRSSVPPEERQKEADKRILEEKEKLNRPYITFKGKIKYITTFIDCAMACDELMTMSNKAEDKLILGFDLEWPFSFQTGPGKVAVIQISPNLNVCYIFHVSELKKLPKALSELLIHPKVRLVGVNIKNDCRKLARDFVGFDGDKMVQNCIDCGVYANTVLPFQQRWSMEKLVGYLLKMAINKDKKVRMSKWHILPLSQEQQIYAAIDAYASLKLHLHLVELEMRNAMKEQDQNSLNI